MGERLRWKTRIAAVAVLAVACTTAMAAPVAGLSGSGRAEEVKRVVNNSPDRYSVRAIAFDPHP